MPSCEDSQSHKGPRETYKQKGLGLGRNHLKQFGNSGKDVDATAVLL